MRTSWMAKVAGGVATVALASTLLAACGGSSPTTTSTTPPSSTTTTTVLHSQPPTAMWPYYGGVARYYTGAAAARGFAAGMLGMVDPTVGTYHGQSSTAGYVDVAPSAVATPTRVRVSLINGSWWATSASTADIAVTSPTSMQLITSPVALRGSAVAFEGVVNVSLYIDGGSVPVSRTTVMGGGDVMRPFTGSMKFSAGHATYGTIIFYTKSMKDGSTALGEAFRIKY